MPGGNKKVTPGIKGLIYYLMKVKDLLNYKRPTEWILKQANGATFVWQICDTSHYLKQLKKNKNKNYYYEKSRYLIEFVSKEIDKNFE